MRSLKATYLDCCQRLLAVPLRDTFVDGKVRGAMRNSQSADIVDRADREKHTHLLDANVDVVTSITLVISRRIRERV